MAKELTEKVLDLVASTARISREKVSLTSSFEELGMDSLDATNLIFAIEEEFGIAVPDETVQIKNLLQLIDGLRVVLAERHDGTAQPTFAK